MDCFVKKNKLSSDDRGIFWGVLNREKAFPVIQTRATLPILTQGGNRENRFMARKTDAKAAWEAASEPVRWCQSQTKHQRNPRCHSGSWTWVDEEEERRRRRRKASADRRQVKQCLNVTSYPVVMTCPFCLRTKQRHLLMLPSSSHRLGGLWLTTLRRVALTNILQPAWSGNWHWTSFLEPLLPPQAEEDSSAFEEFSLCDTRLWFTHSHSALVPFSPGWGPHLVIYQISRPLFLPLVLVCLVSSSVRSSPEGAQGLNSVIFTHLHPNS